MDRGIAYQAYKAGGNFAEDERVELAAGWGYVGRAPFCFDGGGQFRAGRGLSGEIQYVTAAELLAAELLAAEASSASNPLQPSQRMQSCRVSAPLAIPGCVPMPTFIAL